MGVNRATLLGAALYAKAKTIESSGASVFPYKKQSDSFFALSKIEI
ncbi:hypothetical protein GLIP_0893 [Aliiglaciecola lipolytica E3]|uniref:Uncharacterized protein n=1 Tax=Aliiglaciecola lipolytica E3 TaxID=1127673 RepID=K6XPD4_9ALTE|nr:hypothetical protein GLIP_0893 [Aliiglaciecola lipolytica E3]